VTGTYSLRLYAGPKEINLLKNVTPNLEKSIDLGSWLGPIARPLLQLLKLIYAYVKNYGSAIIILTLLVRMLLYPINRKQYKSMKAMQKLGPELAALKKKYANDKQRINMETMNLFKRNKVNPLGGCLPMVLQMPIFFALYRVLYTSVELRHAPFFLWIRDLSAPDPYYISPILMAIAMFFQQKLTPTATMDPAQAKVMKFMPIIFSIFMIALPSGLVLYILVSSLASIPQQVYMTRYNK
jgi:YidC/Oxa1 family membrane protein insertase